MSRCWGFDKLVARAHSGRRYDVAYPAVGCRSGKGDPIRRARNGTHGKGTLIALVTGLFASLSAADVSLHLSPEVVRIEDGTQIVHIVLTSNAGADLALGSIGFAFDNTGAAWAALGPSTFAWIPEVMNDPNAWFAASGLPDPVAVSFSPGAAVPIADGVKVTIGAVTVTPNSVGAFSFSLGTHTLTDAGALALQLKGGDPAAIQVVSSGCCSRRETSGCAGSGVEGCVCAIQPQCCSGVWTCECVALAATACGGCPGEDCNGNGVPDSCDIALGFNGDCNANGVPDACEMPPLCPTCSDCNTNMIPDDCDVALCGDLGGNGGTWVEIDDAGALPADAQSATGVGRIEHIVGETSGDGVDLYRIMITDPLGFSAWSSGDQGGAGGSAAFDTQLWLLDSAGVGIVGNDDNPGALLFHSGLTVPADDGTNAAPAGAGIHYLGVSGFGNEPLSLTGPVFERATFTEISGADGSGGGDAITGWSGGGPTGGYDIFLTGASFISEFPLPCDCNVSGLPDDCDILGGSSDDADGDGVPDECAVVCSADLDCDDLDVCTVDRCLQDAFCFGQPALYGDLNNDMFTNTDDLNCILDSLAASGPVTLACCDRVLGSCSGPGDVLPTADLKRRDLVPCPSAGDPGNMGDGFVNTDDLNGVLDVLAGDPVGNIDPSCSACGKPAAVRPVRPWGETVAAVAEATLTLQPSQSRGIPGGLIAVDVFVDAVADLRTFQVTLDVIGGSRGSLTIESATIDDQRWDYAFKGLDTVSTTGASNGVILATLPSGGVSVDERSYLGSYVLRASADAVGAFTVVLRDDGGTLARSSQSAVIAVNASSIEVVIGRSSR